MIERLNLHGRESVRLFMVHNAVAIKSCRLGQTRRLNTKSLTRKGRCILVVSH